MDVLYGSHLRPAHRQAPRFSVRLLASGMLALLAGLLLGWGQFGGLVETALHVWHRHVLPAFYTLHASGLTFCF